MSEDPPSHNEFLSHPGPATSRVSSLSGDLMKIPNTNKALKIQRRKTKKERNNSRFISHTDVFKKTLLRGVLGRQGAAGGMVCQSGLKDMFNPRPVFITENRLTQHQGIFNHKVKSIDVGRLVDQMAEVGQTGAAPCTVGSVRNTPQNLRSLSPELIPNPESKTQDVFSHRKESSPEKPDHTPEPAAKCQPCPQSHDRPRSEIAMSPFSSHPAPILETVESLVTMLHTHSLFPGRNLMNETQRALFKKMRHLRETNPTPSAAPAQRMLEYRTPGSFPMYKDQRWECLSSGRTDIRRTVPRSQRASQPIQTLTTWMIPLPRSSQTHTLIKMVNPGDHIKLEEIVQRPLHYRCDSNQQTSPHSLSSMPSISSSGPGPNSSRHINSGFFRIRKDGRMTSLPPNPHSLDIRWRLPNDLPTDPSYIYNLPSHNIRRLLACAGRTPLEDVSNEAPNSSGVRMRQCLSGDVFWGSRGQRSPHTRIHHICPTAVRISSRYPSPRRTHSASNVSLQTSVTAPCTSSGFFSLDLFKEPGREMKRRESCVREADVGQSPGRSRPSPRRLSEAQCHSLWKPPSQLREADRLDKEEEMGHNRSSSHEGSRVGPHSQQTHMAAGVSAQSALQKSPTPHGKPEKMGSKSESSAKNWMYPRMKLY